MHRLIYLGAAWASVAGHAERDLDQWRETVHPCLYRSVGMVIEREWRIYATSRRPPARPPISA